ncbi:MAG: TolB family protein [Chitinophagaceae bacterium]
MRKLIGIILFLLSGTAVIAQQFGGNPPSLKWKQIHTDTVRVIFPAGMDSTAGRVASLVHYMASGQPFSMGTQLKKIDIVLQNQTVIANGYVGLGPYRSEFFLTPEMNGFAQGSVSWTDQLALHEYRHVQQINNFNHGFSKLMRTVSGEQGYDLAINAAIPNWFYEGDAVFAETALSSQGRGRLPHFMNAYPALWQAGKHYSWMKLRNGSLRDYVPNHYNLGYLLVNYGYSKYGEDFWKKVTRDASAFKGLFYPFQRAVRRHSGLGYKKFTWDALDDYKKTTERVSHSRDGFLFPVRENYLVNYYFPYAAGADSLVYLKTDYRHRPAFYLKDKTGEHRIAIRDISIDEQFSYRHGTIVYSAYENDPRWGWKDYSVIRILDMKSGEQRSLGSRTRYFTPDISPDLTQVAAVYAGQEGQSGIHILDAGDGQVIQRISSPDIALFTDPKFIDGQNLVMGVRMKNGKMALARTGIIDGKISLLTNPSFNVVGYPCVYGKEVWFTASYSGNDDIFKLRLDEPGIYRATDGPLGNYFVNVSGDKVTFSTFTADGYQLKQAVPGSLTWKKLSPEESGTLQEPRPVTTGQSGGNILSDSLSSRAFPVSKYQKGTGMPNFHSWRPYFSDPVFTYSVYGENVLNTLQTELYYAYNRNDRTNAVGLFGTYGALFPYLTGGAEYTFDNTTTIGNRTRRWAQLDTRAGFSLPFFRVKGKTYTSLNIGSYYVLRNEFNKGFYKDSLGNNSFSYLWHSISWAKQIERAVQHIYPRFAVSFSANHRHAITSVTGYQFSGAAGIYVPGLASTHNLVLTGAFQQRDTLGDVVFSNRFAYSRGYEGLYFSRMWKLSANYHLPLLYPDWGFGNILYFQRVRANLFYDFTKVYSRDKTQTRDQRSVGGEIYFDTKWWNQYPLSFGVRVSRRLDPDQFDGLKGTRFEFILPVNILPR